MIQTADVSGMSPRSVSVCHLIVFCMVDCAKLIQSRRRRNVDVLYLKRVYVGPSDHHLPFLLSLLLHLPVLLSILLHLPVLIFVLLHLPVLFRQFMSVVYSLCVRVRGGG
ncbi:hypothetical protein LSH36_316g04025 [Paralvinella palmiformis]|uniref:Transmembrane protein n=1 Tax=Paralvinella palmiformis TaxID=53620 RepID=A0AAD9N133_9ANNE|nr:hypothetical protein LSH36_316g04025 [Paralvinella palmiformis]